MLGSMMKNYIINKNIILMSLFFTSLFGNELVNNEIAIDLSKFDQDMQRFQGMQDFNDGVLPELEIPTAEEFEKIFAEMHQEEQLHKIHSKKKNRHYTENRFYCINCKTIFSNSKELSTHQESSPDCLRAILAVNLAALKNKPRRIPGVGYVCSFCGKMFHRKSRLIAHHAQHTNIIPYKCDKCNASFTRPDRLKAHDRIHYEGKPFSCEECGQIFTQKHHLKKHIQDKVCARKKEKLALKALEKIEKDLREASEEGASPSL